MKTVLDAVRKVESLDNMICALENMGNIDAPDAMLMEDHDRLIILDLLDEYRTAIFEMHITK